MVIISNFMKGRDHVSSLYHDGRLDKYLLNFIKSDTENTSNFFSSHHISNELWVLMMLIIHY